MAAWGRLDKAALEACLCTAALALAAVMAGSGHLPTLRLLRGTPPPGSQTKTKTLASGHSSSATAHCGLIDAERLPILPEEPRLSVA